LPEMVLGSSSLNSISRGYMSRMLGLPISCPVSASSAPKDHRSRPLAGATAAATLSVNSRCSVSG
jgi:hypothetical protein